MRVIQLTSLKAMQFIIFVAITGWYLSPVYAAGNDTGAFAAVQTPSDSIIAPNVFSPNSIIEDLRFFKVESSNKQPVSLKIYTRAGVLVFNIEARLCVWDGCSLSGQQMAAGVYYYTAEVRGSSPKISKCGFVHLFR